MRSLHEKVTSIFRVDANRPIEVSSLVLADPAGKYWLDYGVLIDDPKLGQPDGAQLKLSIGYRLTTEAGETILEDSEERAYTAFQDTPAGAKQFAPFIVANRLPIEPGAYKLAIEVTNRQSQQTFKGEADVDRGSRETGFLRGSADHDTGRPRGAPQSRWCRSNISACNFIPPRATKFITPIRFVCCSNCTSRRDRRRITRWNISWLRSRTRTRAAASPTMSRKRSSRTDGCSNPNPSPSTIWKTASIA